jgi:type I restriction enzyme, S subunit
MLEKIDLNNLDKSNWKTFKFEEIASKIAETVLPEMADVNIYIGLEHIDGGDMHINRQGAPKDVKGGKLRCYPGDVIFGKRRAYQRKAAIVDFDGICSAHAFVLRANKDVVNAKLFPFFLHSDQFMHRMVDISVGGLSPTINWGDLKNQEFLLPPKEEQNKLAELLWVMDDVIEQEQLFLNKLKVYKKTRMINLLNGFNLVKDKDTLPDGWSIKKIKDLGVISTSSVNKKINHNEENVNLLNYMDVYSSNDKKIDSRVNFMGVTANKNQLKTNQIAIGDVLFTPSSETVDDIGHSAVVTEKMPHTLYSYHLVRLKFYEDMDLNFKRFVFNNPKILYYFSRRAKGVTRMTLSLEDFNETKVRIPPLDTQNKIATELSVIIDNIMNSNSKISNSKAVMKSLINKIF